jgi:hypothetical protein
LFSNKKIRYKKKSYYFTSKKLEKEEKEIETQREHLSYYSATAYYYEIKKMTPQERYGLLKMGPFKIKKRIIEGKALEKLEEIKKKIDERKIISKQKEESLKEYPESKQFFAGVAAGAGFQGYGRLTEKILKTRIPTTKLEKTAEKVAEQAAVGAVTKTVAPEVPSIPLVKTISKVATTAYGLLPKEEHEFQKEEEEELKREQQRLTKEHEQFAKEEEKEIKEAQQKILKEHEQFAKEEEEELKKASGG